MSVREFCMLSYLTDVILDFVLFNVIAQIFKNKDIFNFSILILIDILQSHFWFIVFFSFIQRAFWSLLHQALYTIPSIDTHLLIICA